MAYKEKSPIPIVEGGTGATSFGTTDGTVYYNGTNFITTATGTAGFVLTSGGAGVAPTYQAVSASGAVTSVSGGNNITITGTATVPIVNVSGTTNHSVQLGNASGSLSSLSVGATGTVLIGNTGADPSFSASPTVTSITISNAPSASTDGTNKAYVDAIASGLEFKSAVVAATTANLTATYFNGVSGIGASLTNTGSFVAFSIDGYSPALNDRVLIKDQSSQLQNGIYTVTTVGSGAIAWILTRSTDYNQPSEIQPGDIIAVENGTVNAKTLGTDPIIFTQFSFGPSTFLQVANNLSDVASVSSSRNNLGLTNIATQTTTLHDVLVGAASNGVTSIGPGTAGQVLLSGGASADPSYVTPTAGTGLSVTTNASTLQYALSTPVSVANGGTGAATLTSNGVLLGNTTSAVTATAAGTTGQVLTGVTGSAPTFQSPASSSISITGNSGGALTGNAFTFTGGTSGLTFAGAGSTETLGGTLVVANGGTGAATLTSNGVLLGNGTSAITATAAGTTGQVLTGITGSAPTFQSPASASITITGDTGGGLTGSSFTFAGGTTGLSFGGSGSTETLTFAGITANGGTVSLATDATTSTINVGTGAGVKTSTFGSTNSTSATTLQSGSGALNMTSTNGALTINSGTGVLGISTDASATTLNIGTGGAAKTVVLGSTNTTSTTTLQAGSGGVKLGAVAEGALVTSSTSVISTVTGTAGFVLTANAAGTAPSFQAAPGGGIQTATVTLTSAQIKALHATPITIISTPGSGKLIVIMHATSQLNYGGSNAFVNGGGQPLQLYLGTDSTGVGQIGGGICASAMITSTSSQVEDIFGGFSNSLGNVASSTVLNKALVVSQSSATEISGNAAGNNTISITVWYTTITP